MSECKVCGSLVACLHRKGDRAVAYTALGATSVPFILSGIAVTGLLPMLPIAGLALGAAAFINSYSKEAPPPAKKKKKKKK